MIGRILKWVALVLGLVACALAARAGSTWGAAIALLTGVVGFIAVELTAHAAKTQQLKADQEKH